MSCSFGVLARTVYVLPDATGCASCSRYFPCKASADVLDYYIDFSPWLLQQNDAILTVSDAEVTTLQNDAYDLVILNEPEADGSTVKVVLGYGHAGTTESISVTIQTAMGRTLVVIASIPINDCSPSASYSGGQIITVNEQAIAVNGAVIEAG